MMSAARGRVPTGTPDDVDRPSPVPVTFVNSHAVHGGAELYMQSLIDELGPEWVRGIIVLARGPFVERLRAHGFAVEVVPTPARLGMLPAAWRLRKALLRQRPALVHANGVKAALLAVLATAGTSLPVTWLKVDYSRDGWLGTAIARRCRQVVGISTAVTESFGASVRDRVRIVHCGMPDRDVDRDAGRALVERLVGDPVKGPDRVEGPVIAHVGRLFRAKGQLDLVEAMVEVRARRPDAHALIVGAGIDDPYEREYAAELEQRVSELGLDDAVTFLSNHGDAVKIMSGCELVAIPSMPDPVSGWREGFGFVGVEAMAVGTPVVGYADGSLPEVLGECARLVATGDRAALADAIVHVLGDDSLRRQLVDCGRARAQRYTLAVAADAMARCYVEAVQR